MDYRPILKDQYGDIDNSSRFNHFYCDKQSGGKRQVAFKRWHNENCKHKPK